MSEASRILLIEEDSALADEISGVLENSGYEVQAATDWPYALLLALGFEPQLVILDTSLPGISSSNATQVLQSAPQYGTRFRQVPFLYIAERKNILTQRFTYHPGLPTAEYLFKPIDPEMLLELVRRNLHDDPTDA
jgi:two-component system response regulator RpaA